MKACKEITSISTYVRQIKERKKETEERKEARKKKILKMCRKYNDTFPLVQTRQKKVNKCIYKHNQVGQSLLLRVFEEDGKEGNVLGLYFRCRLNVNEMRPGWARQEGGRAGGKGREEREMEVGKKARRDGR